MPIVKNRLGNGMIKRWFTMLLWGGSGGARQKNTSNCTLSFCVYPKFGHRILALDSEFRKHYHA